jgi:hypothetical protein
MCLKPFFEEGVVSLLLRLGFVVPLVLMPLSNAQTKPSAAAHWEGSISVPSSELKIMVDLDHDANGVWIGSIGIPDQMVKDLPLRNVAVSDEQISFELPVAAGEPKFKGKLSADASTISGEFIQSGNSVPFSLKRNGDPKVVVPAKIALLPEKFVGKWEGNLDAPSGSLHLIFNLSNKDGSGFGTIDSPDQGAMGIPMSEISAAEPSIKIGVRVVSGEYNGKLGEDGKVLTGEWSQGGETMTLVLRKAATPDK